MTLRAVAGGTGGGGGAVTDGDKGDIVVSGSGTVWLNDTTPIAMTTAIDFAVYENLLVLTGAPTLTVSGTPSIGRTAMIRYTGDTVNRVVTLPAGTWRSASQNSVITTFTVPANAQGRILIEKTGASTYDIIGEPSLSTPYANNQYVVPVALVDAATIATDASLSNNFTLTMLTNARVMGAPSNAAAGMVCNWIINTGAGSFTMTWNAVFDFGGAGAPVHSTAAAKKDSVSAVYDGTVWVANFRKGS